MRSRGDPKKLKRAQITKLRSIALDGRRKLADRRWAATHLSEHGIEVGADIPAYATPGEGRQSLLDADGGCITVSEAIKRFRKPALTEEVRKKNVIVYGNGRLGSLQVPLWQFTSEGSVLPGLPAVLEVVRIFPGASQLTPFTFFLQPEPMLGLRTPLEALRIGETEKVLAAAVEHVQIAGNTAKMRDLLLARGVAARPLIEKRSGRSFSSAEVARSFGVTVGTVRSWVATNRCVGYRGIGGRLRLPAWQFSGGKSIHPWVISLINILDVNGWAFVDFVTVPRSKMADTQVANESLLHRAQAGHIDLVMAAARRANPE